MEPPKQRDLVDSEVAISISIDAEADTIEIDIDADELKKRLDDFTPPPIKVTRGVLYKYTRLVSDASRGCVTDE